MELEHSLTYNTEAPSIRPQRIVSVDLLRGLAMMLMVLDHTREYFSGLSFPPEDLNRLPRTAESFATLLVQSECVKQKHRSGAFSGAACLKPLLAGPDAVVS